LSVHVIYVCADPGVPVFGSKGASLHLQEVVRVLTRRGHQVTIIAARKGTRPPQDLRDLPVLTLPSAAGVDAAAREHAARRAAAAVPGLIADAEAINGPAELIYERYSLWSTGGMRAAAARGIPGVLEVNAPLIDEQLKHRYLGDRAGAEEVARTVFSDAAAVIAVSQPVAEWVRCRVANPTRVHVVPNGVDPDRFRPRTIPPRRTFTVGFVGSLKPWHGVDLLIAALRRMDDHVRLLIVGDGPQLQDLRRAAKPLGERVVFTGALAPAAIPAALAQMDVTVAPYPPTEVYFSPLKVFEYMAAGTAVVASAVGQLPSVIEHDRTGLLVPPGDVDALAAAIASLRDQPALRRAYGAQARQAVCERHTWEHVVDTIFRHAGAGPHRVVTLPADDHVTGR
jgi:glycosyltransferase involved in cell wall biosynthesis